MFLFHPSSRLVGYVSVTSLEGTVFWSSFFLKKKRQTAACRVTSPARFDLVPPFELPFGPTLPLDLPPLDPEEGEDVIVDASNMNFLHVPAEVDVDTVMMGVNVERVKKNGV